MNKFRVLLLTASIVLPASTRAPHAQALGARLPREGEKPCGFITKSEAESILGERVAVRHDNDFDCSFVQEGFTGKTPANKRVSLSITYYTSPRAADVNEARGGFANFAGPTLATISKDMPNFADAALWAWSPGYGGRFSAFKAGTIRVEVEIIGIAEEAALAAAKTLAARVLGGVGQSGYVYAGPPNSGALQARAGTGSAPAPAPVPLTGGTRFSQARYITTSQFLGMVKEVSLTLDSDPSLEKYISTAERRNDVVSALAGYGIAVHSNAPVTLLATIYHHQSTYTESNSAGGRPFETRPVHDVSISFQFLIRAAAWRNGSFHSLIVAPATAWYSFVYMENSEFGKALGADPTISMLKKLLVDSVANCLKDIASNTKGETAPWYVNSWGEKEKAAADVAFASMQPGAPVEKRQFDGLDSAPQIELEPNTDDDACVVDPSWRNLWDKTFQRLDWVNTRGPATLTLHHFFYCHYYNINSPHYYWFLDTIHLYESNVVFALNGQLFRKRVELFSALRSGVALGDIKQRLDDYLSRSISEFFTDLVLGNRLPSWRTAG